MPDAINKPETLQQQQYSFAAHLRDPDAPPPDNIEDRRMAVYRDLFINNVTSFLTNSFPVLSELLGEERWQMLIRDYYRDHQSHTPLFPEMPKEFLDYLANERSLLTQTDPLEDPPFMYELAHYEWVETALALAIEPEQQPDLRPSGNLLEEHPVVSTLAWLVSYAFPVNEIGLGNQPEEPAEQASHYVVYRDESFKVHFLKLNIVSARLFELLKTGDELTGKQALQRIAAELQHDDPSAVINAGSQMLSQWRQKDILLGTIDAAPASASES